MLSIPVYAYNIKRLASQNNVVADERTERQDVARGVYGDNNEVLRGYIFDIWV